MLFLILLIISLMSIVNLTILNIASPIAYIVYIVLIFSILPFSYLWLMTRKNTDKYKTIDISNINSSISLVYKFMKLHPEFFNNTIGYKFINYDGDIYPVYDTDLPFYDSIHNVSGIISCSFESSSNSFQYLIKILISNNVNDTCYLSMIDTYIKTQTNIVDLNFYKIMNNALITHNFYNNDVEQWSNDCFDIECGYFSNHKKFIFSIMKNKINYNINTSNSWNNMILEGVPGVGKSSLIYRIALLLKRNIISIDLVLYLDKKKELYAIFHGNDFKLPNDDTKTYNSNNCIIVLEEFDNTIEKLVELERLYKLKIKLINNSQKNKENNLNKKIEHQTTEIQSNDNENYLASQKRMVDESRNFDNSLHSINNDINNIIQIHKEFHKNDILRLGDLLELFQGPIPVKDRIIIGTTNHFERIKSHIPELFRNGRMTPVHFDYLDWNTFNELCLFYFKETLTCNPFVITIPTSQIVELALKIKSTSHDIQQFKDEIIDIQSKIINTTTSAPANVVPNKPADIKNTKAEILSKLRGY